MNENNLQAEKLRRPRMVKVSLRIYPDEEHYLQEVAEQLSAHTGEEPNFSLAVRYLMALGKKSLQEGRTNVREPVTAGGKDETPTV